MIRVIVITIRGAVVPVALLAIAAFGGQFLMPYLPRNHESLPSCEYT
jgi:hypothetical protein